MNHGLHTAMWLTALRGHRSTAPVPRWHWVVSAVVIAGVVLVFAAGLTARRAWGWDVPLSTAGAVRGMDLIRRVEALERQVAYLAWERRYEAAKGRALDRLMRNAFGEPCGFGDSRSWVITDPPGTGSVERMACESATAEVGPCPPWPWATPATTTTTGVER